MTPQEDADIQYQATPDELFRFNLFRLTPKAFVTPTLIGLNVLVFVGMALSGLSIMDPSMDGLIKWGADYGPLVTHGQWWRMLTNTFVHIGIIHILMNMWVLYAVGPFVERLFGNVSYAVLYILSGLGGSLMSLMLKPDILSAGASGAIFGVYGGLVGYLLRQRSTIPKERLTSLAQNAGIFIVFNLGYGLKDNRVDMGAHVGGFLIGLVVGWALALPLSPVNASGRLSRATAVLVCGLAVIGFGATRLTVLDDLSGEIAKFDPVENKALEKFDVVVHKLEGKTITPQEFSEVVLTQVVPPYRDELAKISAMKVPDRQEKLDAQVKAYMNLRIQGYTEIAQGIRDDNQGRVNEGKVKIAKANAFTASTAP